MQPRNRRLISATCLWLLGSLGIASVVIAPLAGEEDHIISQKGKRFGPQDVALRVGEHVTVVNDDDNLVHQAYIEHEAFAFDSGDIEPGDKAVIAFPTEGDFTVLCGVHPKMKLVVRVR